MDESNETPTCSVLGCDKPVGSEHDVYCVEHRNAHAEDVRRRILSEHQGGGS